jgi:hypothetical protein
MVMGKIMIICRQLVVICHCRKKSDAGLDVVFWIMTPCGDAVGYQHFGGPSCLHL